MRIAIFNIHCTPLSSHSAKHQQRAPIVASPQRPIDLLKIGMPQKLLIYWRMTDTSNWTLTGLMTEWLSGGNSYRTCGKCKHKCGIPWLQYISLIFLEGRTMSQRPSGRVI